MSCQTRNSERFDPEYLGSMEEIIRYTGVPRRTFYAKGLSRKLKESRYVFCRRGKYGQLRYWSYKRLILAFLAENFPPPIEKLV